MTSEYIRYIFRYIFCYIMCIHIFRESSRCFSPTSSPLPVAPRGGPASRGKTWRTPARCLPINGWSWLSWSTGEEIWCSSYPLVNVYITMERSTIFNGKINYKWPCSIATLNYQRVSWNWDLTNNSRVSHRSCDFWTPQCNNVKTKTRGTSRERDAVGICSKIGIHWNHAQYVLSNKMQWKIVKAPR